jgi:hypothetical protein
MERLIEDYALGQLINENNSIEKIPKPFTLNACSTEKNRKDIYKFYPGK